MDFLTDDQILPTINQMVKEASSSDTVYLVSPYLKLNERVRQAVEMGRNSRAELVFITRRNVPDRSDADIRWLLDNKVTVFELEHLHAKIYWAKNKAIVTSLNLHDSSHNNSREVAVVFDEPDRIDELRKLIESWKASSIELKPSQLGASAPRVESKEFLRTKEKAPAQSATPSPVSRGFCIRCGTSKTFNAEYPLCDEHYKEWAKYKNEQYKEKYCHRCGRPADTTKVKPLCPSCYKLVVA